MKPQDMAKVAEAQAEFDHYDKVWVYRKYRGLQHKLSPGIHAPEPVGPMKKFEILGPHRTRTAKFLKNSDHSVVTTPHQDQ